MPSAKKNEKPFINTTSKKLLIKKIRSWNPKWKRRSSRSRNTARSKVRPLDVIRVTFVNRLLSFTFTRTLALFRALTFSWFLTRSVIAMFRPRERLVIVALRARIRVFADVFRIRLRSTVEDALVWALTLAR